MLHLTKRIQNARYGVVEAKAGGGCTTPAIGQAAARWYLVQCTAGQTRRCQMPYVEGNSQYARFFYSTAAAG